MKQAAPQPRGGPVSAIYWTLDSSVDLFEAATSIYTDPTTFEFDYGKVWVVPDTDTASVLFKLFFPSAVMVDDRFRLDGLRRDEVVRVCSEQPALAGVTVLDTARIWLPSASCHAELLDGLNRDNIRVCCDL